MPSPLQHQGRRAESLACNHLQRQGLHLMTRNWHCRGGELDLVMRDGVEIVFVEVKARAAHATVPARESIDGRKRQRIVRAASRWLARNGPDQPCRFDVVAITQHEKIDEIEWIRGAFDAS